VNPDNITQVTLYWYEKATFKTGFSVEQKYVRISLVILMHGTENCSLLEEELLAVGKVISASWEPMKTQALVSLGIPAQQSLLVASIVFLVATGTAQYSAEKRRAANNLKIFYNFGSLEEKNVLQTIDELSREKKFLTTGDILEGVKKRIRKQMGTKRVLSILNTLEEHGLIRKTIATDGNAPRLVWRV
jgi:hypothetical protein